MLGDGTWVEGRVFSEHSISRDDTHEDERGRTIGVNIFMLLPSSHVRVHEIARRVGHMSCHV